MRKTESFPYIRWEGTQMQQEPEKRVGKLSQRTDRRVFAALFLLAVISGSFRCTRKLRRRRSVIWRSFPRSAGQR